MSFKCNNPRFPRWKHLLAGLFFLAILFGGMNMTAYAALPLSAKPASPKDGDLYATVPSTTITKTANPFDEAELMVYSDYHFERYSEDEEDWVTVSSSAAGDLSYTWTKDGQAISTTSDYICVSAKEECGNYSCTISIDGEKWATVNYAVTFALPKTKGTLTAGQANQTVEHGLYLLKASRDANYKFYSTDTTKSNPSINFSLYDADLHRLGYVDAQNQTVNLKANTAYYLKHYDVKNTISIELSDLQKANDTALNTVKAAQQSADAKAAAALAAQKSAEAKAAATAIPAKLKVTVKAKKAALTVKWPKQTNVSGYELQIATNKKFTKNLKAYTIKKAKTSSKTIKKLKKGTKYFVRVRGYKKVGGGRITGPWSKVVKKKVK